LRPSTGSGRYAAAFLTLLANYRADNFQRAFASYAPPVFALIILALFFPTELADHWRKAFAGVIAYLIVAPIVYVLILRALPKNPAAVSVGLSPLYTDEGRRQFRAGQLQIKQRFDQLSSQSARLAADMAKVDLTTMAGQEQLKLLSIQKAEIDRELAGLKPSIGKIGYVPK
jgi:hypothetical protein